MKKVYILISSKFKGSKEHILDDFKLYPPHEFTFVDEDNNEINLVQKCEISLDVNSIKPVIKLDRVQLPEPDSDSSDCSSTAIHYEETYEFAGFLLKV